MRVRLPIVLLLILIVYFSTSNARSQNPSDVRVKVTNLREFHIPFTADRTRPIKELRLFAQKNNGEWQFLSSAQPNNKGFNFRTNEDGTYALTVQTEFTDGTTDPPREQLTPELKVIVDSTPPKFVVRSFASGDSAGVEWEIQDETGVEAASIRLEYRWPGMAEWRPIDPGVAFRARDQRSWVLRQDQKIEIRIKARDGAKNDGVSQGTTTFIGVGDNRQFGSGGGGSGSNLGSGGSGSGGGEMFGKGADSGSGRGQPTIHYVNDKELSLDYNVTVGSSGLKAVRMYRTENGQEWQKKEDFIPKDNHPAVVPGDRARTERLTITHKVEKEGEYGFILIAESKAGKSGPAPRLKDSPQIRVIVDTTPPQVRNVDAKVRRSGDQGVAVDITWSADDLHMAAAPITIKYAEKREGPWRVLAAALDNSGRYTWNVPPSEPHSFFLKVEAIDRATNTGEGMKPETVELDLTVPQVEINNVAPAKQKPKGDGL